MAFELFKNLFARSSALLHISLQTTRNSHLFRAVKEDFQIQQLPNGCAPKQPETLNNNYRRGLEAQFIPSAAVRCEIVPWNRGRMSFRAVPQSLLQSAPVN